MHMIFAWKYTLLYIMGEGPFPSLQEIQHAIGSDIKLDHSHEPSDSNTSTLTEVLEARKKRRQLPECQKTLESAGFTFWTMPACVLNLDTQFLDSANNAYVDHMSNYESLQPCNPNDPEWRECFEGYSIDIDQAMQELAERQGDEFPPNALARMHYFLFQQTRYHKTTPIPTTSFLMDAHKLFEPNGLALVEVGILHFPLHKCNPPT